MRFDATDVAPEGLHGTTLQADMPAPLASGAVDSQAQAIVAPGVRNSAADVHEREPMIKPIRTNTGRQTDGFSADVGRCSAGTLAVLDRHHVDPGIAGDRQRHRGANAPGRHRTSGTRGAAARPDWARAGRRRRYRLRKTLPEPDFAQIPQAREFRPLLPRRLADARGERKLIGTVHNLRKLAKAENPYPGALNGTSNTSRRAPCGAACGTAPCRRHFRQRRCAAENP